MYYSIQVINNHVVSAIIQSQLNRQIITYQVTKIKKFCSSGKNSSGNHFRSSSLTISISSFETRKIITVK